MAQQAYAIIAAAPMSYIAPDGSSAQAAAGTVINRVMWDGSSSWAPPAGTEARADPTGTLNIGATTAV
ncbi:hypothetical protein HN018_06965 [Lichenicola cladoniae]|uniref:Uncharacterized protein n=1 Tax=Lichenicola cladoniae TaxID=1484109 RepID=A0A6M8H4N2_9PROT|nr:hypothetical protein [Lichenicola cladoniae]NPD67314.1 hypothetical protein [Acetobacteraceae bacterium]QKE88641.1 hypothetical protein HN018_06965 [Lichenicola cladoniae]